MDAALFRILTPAAAKRLEQRPLIGLAETAGWLMALVPPLFAKTDPQQNSGSSAR